MDRGSRPQRRVRPLHSSTWPVRWRLALASAGLTLAILLVFGAMVGHFAGNRVGSDFDREVRDAAQTIASNLSVIETPTGTYLTHSPALNDVVLPNDAAVRVFDAGGNLLDQSTGAEDLGAVSQMGAHAHGRMEVVTLALSGPNGALSGYVQYARNKDPVDSTIARIWLLVAVGVLAGTLLASLAGLALADRAMRPIATLTAKAREVGATRDPSRHIPPPQADDEVGELARTLEQMLRSLDAARGEREEALQRQREFVADASHELRTPLTSVLANLELLEASLRDDSEQRDAVASALRSSRRMTRLVGDLLLLARADAGRETEKSQCDLANIARNAAEEVSPVLGDRELTVDAEETATVEGNTEELHRMVLNLLDNAAHHTPRGTHVSLRVRGDNGDAAVEVSDDGPGIPEAKREEVFDRFVRGTGPADRSSGTGLGLAIVRAVAKSHGGTAEVADSQTGGALFRVRLPVVPSDLDHDRQDHRTTA